MDPNNRGPEERGHGGGGRQPRPRPPRDPLTPDFGQHAPSVARTTEVFTDDLLLTVNPVDGSEIELCPPERTPERPAKLTVEQRAEAERAAVRAAALPADASGAGLPALPLLERQEAREELVRLLARGRSVRLVGPSGSGRSRLLDVVAEDCADLAPDGVIRLGGLGRSADELLGDLFHAAYGAPRRRPSEEELHRYLGEIGAVVVVDDIAFGGADLTRLLEATPECAFLISATPDVPEPAAEALTETVALDGLTRAAGVQLLAHAAGRDLTEEETTWAGDLWFESEGLPLRFVQAGALLRQRDRLRAATDAVDEVGVFEDAVAVPEADLPFDTREEAAPLPSLAEGAAPAPLLASRLSPSARDALRFAVALGGELPHPAHLPALVGDTHADGALGELLGCALVSCAGGRHRLAAGVLAQLEAAGYQEGAELRVRTAAEHYAWWTGHQSVTPERVSAEAPVVLAVLAALPPADDGPALRLARNAAPAFASGLAWAAWEQVLRSGAEAARLAGEVGEQGYFHHELGVLALCQGRYERARTELDTAVALRATSGDKRGLVAGRRALALVADRTGDLPGMDGVPADGGATGAAGAASLAAFAAFEAFGSGDGDRDTRRDVPAALAQPGTSVFPGDTPVTRRPGPAAGKGRDGGLLGGARKNLVAAGAGALLVAVLGTVVTLGATGGDQDVPTEGTGPNPSASQGYGDELGADEAADDSDTGSATSRPTDPGPDGVLGTPDDVEPPATSGDPTTGGDEDEDDTATSGGGGSTSKPPTSKPPASSKPPTGGTGSPSSGGSGTPGSPSGGTDAGTTDGTTGGPTDGGTTEGGTGDGGTTDGGADGGGTTEGGGTTDGADGGATTTTSGGQGSSPSLTSAPEPGASSAPSVA
ncbi:ATP-binding protein [Streptomyces sp. NPDC005012]|uniref:ATP-binding protein n=1 Tax=Streptomyces sp. NPDC005012 TaxID=3154558 RepID=UPI0033A6F253